jgi:hypothetical protein
MGLFSCLTAATGNTELLLLAFFLPQGAIAQPKRMPSRAAQSAAQPAADEAEPSNVFHLTLWPAQDDGGERVSDLSSGNDYGLAPSRRSRG